ncbi:glyoxylate reductase [Limosilactobacillus frumenti DSM 13145]|uniref:Glyoxylate reductase n=1 Tax=Limosilactobacillus frumenti DSM 13145 TaxID=1423746 RepID=A0A0R1P636_9LACO|nr:2-hydroxyacid dehydrogenase family protein [Limosilactobacillus frumenti]KRL28046.1 glyoxylate reductase [Limosilactobacillus frumenti DSM 13145]MBA2913461.1 hydroxyacid dehydrogenase [Limosilactobacillus frumenti]QFG73127.1 hydroxyacid dehydrogenase [Limosilactobacillus frumenti]
MATVYLSAKLPKVASKMLDQAGIDYEVFDGDGLITKDELLKHVTDCKVLITPLSTQVDKDVINAAPNLKLIANFGAGFNNIDTDYARTKGIDVTNTPFVSSTATAEVASGLVIALMRRIVEGDHRMRTIGFDGWAPLFFLGHELAGKTLGIVGLGSIGRGVAQRLHAFDMKIIYTQRHQADPATEAHYNAEYVSLDELLKRADVVTLHCPLTPETHHMIDAPQFAMMKDSAMIINCARGPVLNEDALLKALQGHKLAGAALDVYEAEPNVADGFKKLKNVILTPHIGNASFEARDAMAKIVAGNALNVLKGESAQYIVNK